jgi:hypothetical protein
MTAMRTKGEFAAAQNFSILLATFDTQGGKLTFAAVEDSPECNQKPDVREHSYLKFRLTECFS